MRGLKGRRVSVTGGASGIGRAAAIRLSEEGCLVGILDLDEAGATETVARCDGRGWARRADITNREAVQAAVSRFEDEVGPIDGLANIAGGIARATSSIRSRRCGTGSSLSISMARCIYITSSSRA
jgi:2-hydroxycyclohexanecarboxyl-CoA dehydrogenase